MHGEHSIRVRNSWNRGMALFIDEVCRASTNKLLALSKSKPVLRYEIASGTSSSVIEVFCYAMWTIKAKIVADGKQIGSDTF